MNKIIAFANQKGGVGKTTLCILFADYLAWKKKGVVLAILKETLYGDGEKKFRI